MTCYLSILDIIYEINQQEEKYASISEIKYLEISITRYFYIFIKICRVLITNLIVNLLIKRDYF